VFYDESKSFCLAVIEDVLFFLHPFFGLMFFYEFSKRREDHFFLIPNRAMKPRAAMNIPTCDGAEGVTCAANAPSLMTKAAIAMSCFI
jgi:hypothetical protein